MKFTKPLIKGKLIKRYKRFFTDVKIGKEIIIAHCPNTGSMRGLLDEGNEVYVSKNDNPKRKLKYTPHRSSIRTMCYNNLLTNFNVCKKSFISLDKFAFN